MTLQQIKAILESTGLPLAYYAFPAGQAPDLPFLVYLVVGTQNFAADGIVYQCIQTIQIELYTDIKDPATEARLEKALADAGIYWEKAETYLTGENCFEIIYTIEV